MKLKMSLVLSLLVLQSVQIQTKSDATLIGRFEVEASELAGHPKTFVNNSKYDLVIRWSIKDTQTGKFYRQEPVLKRGDLIKIHFETALKYLDESNKLEFSLELLRVRQMPKGAGHPLITTPFKAGSAALALYKFKFLKNDTFAISLNKNGLLVCKSS
jgi:hypothetical protein